MKFGIRAILIILTLWTGGLIIQANSNGIWEGPLFEFSYLKYFFFVLSLVASIVTEVVCFFETKKGVQLIPLGIITVITTIILVQLYRIDSIERDKTIITINHLPGSDNVLTIEFKAAGSFKLIEHSRLGPTIYYGNYIQNGNELTIVSGNHEESVVPYNCTGRIINDTVYWNNFDTMLVESNMDSN